MTGDLSLKPVADPIDFLDRTEDIKEIVRHMCSGTPQNCMLQGESRIGKTSMLLFLAHPHGAKLLLEKESKTRAWARTFRQSGLVAYVSCERLVNKSPNEFWQAAMIAIEGASGFRASGLESEDPYTGFRIHLQQLFAHGPNRSSILYLMLDDIDFLFESLQSADLVLSNLRDLSGLAFPGQLAIVGAATRSLVDLHRVLALRFSSFATLPVSPFGNDTYFQRIGLLGIDRDTVGLFLQSAARRAGVAGVDGPEFVNLLWEEGGRHPALLKVTCVHLFRAMRQMPDYDTDFSAFREFLSYQLRQDPTVQLLYEGMFERRSPSEKTAITRVANGLPADDQEATHSLIELGLVEIIAGQVQLFAASFAAWVRLRSGGLRPEADRKLPPPSHAQSSLRYDSDRRIVERDGTQIPLTGRENDVLALLLSVPGQLWSRESLHEALWRGSDAKDAVVVKIIDRLRSKLEDDPKRPRRIVTHYGRGYSVPQDAIRVTVRSR